ncbi:Ubiquitin carboxyl-terminal hydrolase 37 [Mortierella hygrophila]|uniref:Ubiquitin carboxyl-terminal hydrolase 37 n=1 Tax=Mortierella hygrophila TaxID=979708 RepID=A0A9P6K4M3_9FUNG|nr:Ubiquitin carboxyl-terminal hydrolase 37 [Mortierella hygrophila]
MTSDNTDLAVLADDDYRPPPGSFRGFVHAVDLERTSLSRKFENVQCWLACDDTASVNLYLDLRKELDYVEFKLTQNIRQVYFTDKTRTVKLHLNNKMRLDITLTALEDGQKLYEQLMRIKARPGDCDDFSRHRPKVGVVKPDASSAYLTAKNDLAPDLPPIAVGSAESSTQSRKRVIQHFTPSTAPEHTLKKSRAVASQDLFKSHRQSYEVVDSVLSTSPPAPQATPERWPIPSSPARDDLEIITPNRAQVFDRFARIGHSAHHMPDPVPRPQFHAKVPTPRVLRSMNDRSKRYGRELDHKSSKDSRVLEKRSSGSKCINAVLQAILCLNPLVPDLTDSYLLLICGVQDGLFQIIVDTHTAYSETGNLMIKEDEVSNRIIKSSTGCLGGEFDDAREFLNDCLNQVRKEFNDREENPISQMFRGKIDRVSECPNCGNMIRSSEQYQDLQLEVPAHDVSSSKSNQDAVSIGSLVPQLFDTKTVECQKCHSDQAIMHRSLSQLPEVLVLCLKRFSPNPVGGYKKYRSHVTIDATLEFTQFCSAEAFTDEVGSLAYFQEDFGMRPHIPSDSVPSSSSSPFSSVSPRGQHDHLHTLTPPAERYMAQLREDGTFGTTSDFPILLDSDGEDAIIMASQQSQESLSFYEAPTEEEQYQWAMEESIRASQMTMSQSSITDNKLQDETEEEGEVISSQVFGLDNPFAHPDFASRIKRDSRSLSGCQRTSAQSSNVGTPKISPKLELPDRRDTFTVHEDKDKGVGKDGGDKKDKGGDGDGGDDEGDEDFKAAVLASLMTGDISTSPTEADVQEQEKKHVEEAIRRSLMDQEENKENISPDKASSQKKLLEKKKMVATLTRSCSQLNRSPSDRHHRHQNHHLRKSLPAQLKRSSTIDFIDQQRFSRGSDQVASSFSQPYSLSQSPSPTETASQPLRLELTPRTRRTESIGTTRRHGAQDRDEQHDSRSSMICLEGDDDDATPSRRVTRASKGKDRASSSSQTQAVVDQSLGLFQLQAVVSHTGLSMSSSSPVAAAGQKGRYVCDRLGTDGIWRCHDGAKTTRLGSISDLTRYRARSGYLFFYVRCHPGAVVA